MNETNPITNHTLLLPLETDESNETVVVDMEKIYSDFFSFDSIGKRLVVAFHVISIPFNITGQIGVLWYISRLMNELERNVLDWIIFCLIWFNIQFFIIASLGLYFGTLVALQEGKPSRNYFICSREDPQVYTNAPKRVLNVHLFILRIILLVYFFTTIQIWREKMRDPSLIIVPVEPVLGIQTHRQIHIPTKLENIQTSLLNNVVFFSIGFFGLVCNAPYDNVDMAKLNKYPTDIYIYFLHHGISQIIGMLTIGFYYIRTPKMRKILQREIVDVLDKIF